MHNMQSRMDGRVAGKVAIVTGAASGIGAATAALLAREGARVVIADLNESAAETQAESIRSQGGDAVAVKVDLVSEDSVAALMQTTLGYYGALHILHNNAAHTVLAQTRDTDIEHMSTEVWDTMMQVNLRGTMLAIKHAVAHMRRCKGGSIINTSSISSLAGGRNSAYGVSKAAINGLTRYVATQYGHERIRCNAIAPGVIETPATSSGYAAGSSRELILRQKLIPRLGETSDIAYAVLYLASDESAFVTGQVFNVDGGLLAHQPYWADFKSMASSAEAGTEQPRSQ